VEQRWSSMREFIRLSDICPSVQKSQGFASTSSYGIFTPGIASFQLYHYTPSFPLCLYGQEITKLTLKIPSFKHNLVFDFIKLE
jgi:hypothetical protein